MKYFSWDIVPLATGHIPVNHLSLRIRYWYICKTFTPTQVIKYDEDQYANGWQDAQYVTIDRSDISLWPSASSPVILRIQFCSFLGSVQNCHA